MLFVSHVLAWVYPDGCWITFLRDQGEGLIAFWLQFRLLFTCLFALCLLRDMKRKLPVEFDEKDQRKFDYAVHVCEWDPFLRCLTLRLLKSLQ